MSNCFEYCLCCDSIQEYKVNFVRVHGVCRNHCSNNHEFHKCIYCGCIVPITAISQIIRQNSTHPVNSNIIRNSAMEIFNSIPQCEYCLEFSIKSQISCHIICENCSKDKCPICLPKEPLINPCEFCHNFIQTTNLKCGHQVCADCSASGCKLCDLINSLKKEIQPEHKAIVPKEILQAESQTLTISQTWEKDSYVSSNIFGSRRSSFATLKASVARIHKNQQNPETIQCRLCTLL